MKEGFKQEFDSLERKVKLLLSEHRKLKNELTESQQENDRLKTQLSLREGELSNFQNRFKISKLVKNMVAEGEDSKELKEVLDDYIKEIDKCIAHLGDV